MINENEKYFLDSLRFVPLCASRVVWHSISGACLGLACRQTGRHSPISRRNLVK